MLKKTVQSSERRELAPLRIGYVVLLALAPVWCLIDAGGAVITDCIGCYASVFRTASFDFRIGAIVQTCHGRVPAPEERGRERAASCPLTGV